MNEESIDIVKKVLTELASIKQSLNLPAVAVRYKAESVTIEAQMGDQVTATLSLTPDQMRDLVTSYCVEQGLYLATMACGQSDMPL